MIDQVLQKLIEFLQNASPLVWHTLIKQVYVDAIMNLVWAIILFIPFIILIRQGNYNRAMLAQERKDRSTQNSEDHWEGAMWLYYVVSIFPGGLAVYLFTSALGFLINPEYYAIRYIISTITGGSQ